MNPIMQREATREIKYLYHVRHSIRTINKRSLKAGDPTPCEKAYEISKSKDQSTDF